MGCFEGHWQAHDHDGWLGRPSTPVSRERVISICSGTVLPPSPGMYASLGYRSTTTTHMVDNGHPQHQSDDVNQLQLYPVSVTLATTLSSTTGLSSLSRMSHRYVTQRPVVGTLLHEALMHSHPPASNCARSHDQALRHAPQTVISLGKQGSDNVPDVATAIATRFLPDPSSVDIKKPCGHEVNHQ